MTEKRLSRSEQNIDDIIDIAATQDYKTCGEMLNEVRRRISREYASTPVTAEFLQKFMDNKIANIIPSLLERKLHGGAYACYLYGHHTLKKSIVGKGERKFIDRLSDIALDAGDHAAAEYYVDQERFVIEDPKGNLWKRHDAVLEKAKHVALAKGDYKQARAYNSQQMNYTSYNDSTMKRYHQENFYGLLKEKALACGDYKHAAEYNKDQRDYAFDRVVGATRTSEDFPNCHTIVKETRNFALHLSQVAYEQQDFSLAIDLINDRLDHIWPRTIDQKFLDKLKNISLLQNNHKNLFSLLLLQAEGNEGTLLETEAMRELGTAATIALAVGDDQTALYILNVQDKFFEKHTEYETEHELVKMRLEKLAFMDNKELMQLVCNNPSYNHHKSDHSAFWTGNSCDVPYLMNQLKDLPEFKAEYEIALQKRSEALSTTMPGWLTEIKNNFTKPAAPKSDGIAPEIA